MTEVVSAWRRAAATLVHRWYHPVDPAWLAAFRVLFGTVMCVSMLRFLVYGWVDAFFVKPRFHFSYWGFEWVRVLPEPYMHGLFALLAVCAAAMAVGLWFRLATSVFALGFAYVQLIDVTNYLNHYYLAWLLSVWLGLSPAGHYWSLDAIRDRHRVPTVAFVWSFAFRFQVGVVYTFAGIAKAHADWLFHGQPLSIWLGANTDLPVLGAVFQWPYVPWLMSWAGFLFDTLVIWFLLWRRTRWFAYVAVLAFHTMTRTLFPIGMFSIIMVLSALVFFPHDWPRGVLAYARAVWSRLAKLIPGPTASHVEPAWAGPVRIVSASGTRGEVSQCQRTSAGASRTLGLPSKGAHDALEVNGGSAEPPAPQPLACPSRRRWLGAGLIAGYCMLQVLMPLRFLVYGGNVRWHEQGMRFSWRVMVREKNGAVSFRVTDVQTGRTFEVAPRTYLTRRQEREMSGQPDLILQLAHRIRDDYQARFGRPVQVRVEALVSLNGRRMAPLIDPEVDLARVRDGIHRFHWVLPAPTSAPPQIRPI